MSLHESDLEVWTDHRGDSWDVSHSRGPLSFRYAKQRALRAFVFARSRFMCEGCGLAYTPIPNYDGRDAVFRPWPWLKSLQVDHRIPRSKGGTHHPSNLQALCFGCNAKKGAR